MINHIDEDEVKMSAPDAENRGRHREVTAPEPFC